MTISFLKFGNNKYHLNSFVTKGEIYINTAEYFRKVDEQSKLFDKHELSDSYHQPENTKLNLDGREFNIASPFSIRYLETSYTHIFCMLDISEESIKKQESTVFDPRLWNDFGEYVVLIHKPKEFIDRLFSALEEKGITYAGSSKVDYFDEHTYEGETGPFKKRLSYSYQNEFRVALRCKENDRSALKINIGNIRDIAHGPVHKQLSKNKIQGNELLI